MFPALARTSASASRPPAGRLQAAAESLAHLSCSADMSQPWAELLLIIHVNLSRGPRDIHVHNGDNVRALALDFCASSCINLTHAGRIEEVIRVQVNRLAESWQSAPSMSASELAVDQAGSIVSSPRRSAVEQSPLENSGFTVSSSRETTAAKAAAPPHHHSRQQAASASPAATPAPARSGPPRWEALHADSYDRKARLSLVRNHQSAVHMQRHSPNINRYDDGTGPKQHAVSNPLAAAPVFDLAGGAGPSITGGSAGATNSAWSSKQQQSAPSPSPSRGRKPPARQRKFRFCMFCSSSSSST